MKTVFFESLRYKLVTKNDFYNCSCPDIHFNISERHFSFAFVTQSGIATRYYASP